MLPAHCRKKLPRGEQSVPDIDDEGFQKLCVRRGRDLGTGRPKMNKVAGGFCSGAGL